MKHDADITSDVKDFWEEEACGTDARVTASERLTLPYFEEVEAFRYTYEDFIHAFAQFSRARGKTVLEVGVGAATDFLQWVRSGAEAHGVDLTEEGVEHARTRLSLYGLEAASLTRASAETLPFEDGTFDIAYSWGVIHHADSMENCLAEMVRTTKSGGRVKVMLYNKYSLYTLSLLIQHGWLKGKIFKSLDWALWNHMESIGTKGYSRSDVDRFARAYGCTVERVDFYEQKIRKGARFERLRRVMRALTPTPWLFYMAFELRKL